MGETHPRLGVAHPPAKMLVADRYNHVKRGSRRSWRVWWDVRDCPTCALRKRTLHNTNSGHSFFCHGDRVIRTADSKDPHHAD